MIYKSVKMSRRSFLAATSVVLGACVAPMACRPAQAAPKASHVFVISFDGGKPAVMQQSKMPTLFAMKEKGAGTWDARTIFPSITLISHTSMLTGVGPAKHKVMWNTWIPENGVVKVPTAFELARKQKLSTSMFVGKEKFLHLTIPGSLNEFWLTNKRAIKVAEAAAKSIVENKPNLCFIHFPDSDSAGHSFGWGSPEQIASFAEEDDALKIVKDAIEKAGIADSSVMIMTADHGGHDKTHGSNSLEDMTIPWIAWGGPVKEGFTVPEQVTTYDTAATALWLLDVPIPADWDGKPVISAFK